MHNERKGKMKGLFLGLLSGAAVGSVLTFLFAPKSGKEFQRDIKTKSKDFIEDVEQYITKTKEKVSGMIYDSKNKTREIASDTKDKVNILLNDAEKLLNEAKGKADSLGSKGMKKFEKEIERLKETIQSLLKT